MKIAVLGTGMVGQAVAGRLHELGHSVVVGTRDPEATLGRTEPDGMGNPPFSAWHSDHEGVAVVTFADAAAGAELVASLTLLGLAGEENLAGKVLLDIANPLDFSHGFPPTLFVKDTDSLGESSTIFVSGDDAQAKATVVSLLESFGHDDVIDLGPLETARGTEMLLPIWLRLMGALGTGQFNFKIVR